MYEALFARAGLSLERLRTFREIAAAGGISAAAAGDPNRQSQFSRQLRELEKFFGTELIRRGRGPLRLTEAGRGLLELSGVALGGLEAFLSRCAGRAVSVTVGAGEGLLQWWLLPRMARQLPGRPGVELTFRNLRNEEIVQGVLDGSVDLGVVSRAPEEGRLAVEELGPLEYRLFVPRRLLSTGRVPRGSAVLKGLPLGLLEDGSAIAAALEREFGRLKGAPRVVLRLSSYPQLAAVVRDGRAAAVMPALAEASLAGAEVATVSLPFLGPLTREVRLIWNPAMVEVRPALGRLVSVLGAGWRVAGGGPGPGAVRGGGR